MRSYLRKKKKEIKFFDLAPIHLRSKMLCMKTFLSLIGDSENGNSCHLKDNTLRQYRGGIYVATKKDRI